MIGCVPIFEIFSANSKAPHKFDVSHNANDLNLFSFEKSFNDLWKLHPHILNIEYELLDD